MPDTDLDRRIRHSEGTPGQPLKLGERNHAPTPEHASHHVYGVHLSPHHPQPFLLSESIGGGHAERGGAIRLDLPELLAWRDWQGHFQRAGCGWAVALVESGAQDPQALLDALVLEADRRKDGHGA